MWPVSGRFLDALRRPHARVATASFRNVATGDVIDIPIEDGSVTVDATSNVRRTLSLTTPPDQALWDLLETPGGEITVTQGIQFVDGSVEAVPLGVFVVDQDQIGYGPGGTISMTCPDRWVKVQRNRFGLNRASIPANMAWQEIKRLVEGAWTSAYPFPGWAQLDTTATTKVGSLLWDDGDREGAIHGLTVPNSVEVFFDPQGFGVLRPVPLLTPSAAAVWMVDASASGVMIDASRSRDRSTVRNALVLTTAASDVVFDPVEVKNTTPGDPLNVTGPLGYVAEDYSSAAFRNSDQALTAGKTLLARRLGVAKQLSLTNVGNPALDAEDVITALLPPIDRNTPRDSELHIIDTVSHPLAPSGTQEIATRSTRPSTDGS